MATVKKFLIFRSSFVAQRLFFFFATCTLMITLAACGRTSLDKNYVVATDLWLTADGLQATSYNIVSRCTSNLKLTLELKQVGNATLGNTSIVDGRVYYQPLQDGDGQEGNAYDSFTYTIIDPQGNTASATVFVTLRHSNRFPVAVDDVVQSTDGSAIIIDVLANDSDVDLDELEVTAENPEYGSIEVDSDQTITYTPAAGFIGTDYFTYTINDGREGEASAIVQIEVGPIDELVLYLPFNGNANDLSDYNNDTEILGEVSLATDRFGNSDSAYSFDGIDDYIKVISTTNLNFGFDDLTLCFWIKFTGDTFSGSAGQQMIVSKGDYTATGFGVSVYDNRIATFIGSGDTTNPNPEGMLVNNDYWHFITVRRIDGVLETYVDNEIQNEETNQNNISNDDCLVFGGYYPSGDKLFNGIIDDIRIYHRALSEGELILLAQ
ncbi:MAG: cadherin-like domain-containing protein [Deltaproteobacteria bacterium]|nr:cadherin-like domain-containing protein [Deltaproteobacteria bacterium]